MPQHFAKDRDAELDYTIDWSDWMSAGDIIQTSVWNTTYDLEILINPAPSFAASSTTVWIKSGLYGRTYKVKNTITTVQKRKEERTITITIEER